MLVADVPMSETERQFLFYGIASVKQRKAENPKPRMIAFWEITLDLKEQESDTHTKIDKFP